jgi:hypothetical protein
MSQFRELEACRIMESMITDLENDDPNHPALDRAREYIRDFKRRFPHYEELSKSQRADTPGQRKTNER